MLLLCILGGLDAMCKQSNGTTAHHKMNGVDNVTNFASLNGHDNPQGLSYVAHPMEPHDIDRPVRCPPPEPCIMHVSNIRNPANPNSVQLSLNSGTCLSKIAFRISAFDVLRTQLTCEWIVIKSMDCASMLDSCGVKLF